MSSPRPPWYLTPYVLWLGFADWFLERSRVTHGEALVSAAATVKHQGYPWLRRVGIGAGLLSLLVLFTVHVLAPLTESVAPSVPSSAVLPASAGLAALTVLLLLFLVIRTCWRALARTYARGLRVLARRALHNSIT